MSRLSHNQKVKKLFYKLIRELNSIHVEPIVYGSLGLNFLFGDRVAVNDIDLIVPNIDLKKRWPAICDILLARMHYRLDLDHKQEFLGYGVPISFIAEQEVKKLIEKELKKNKQIDKENLKYYLLLPQQHLLVYKKGILNKFRRQKKLNEDMKKIILLNKHIPF